MAAAVPAPIAGAPLHNNTHVTFLFLTFFLLIPMVAKTTALG